MSKRLSGLLSVTIILLTAFGSLNTPVRLLHEHLRKIGLESQDWARIVLVITASLLVMLGSELSERRARRAKRRLMSFQSCTKATLSPDGSGERTSEFQNLRAEARVSIFSMGIGMTQFSSNLSLLDKLVDDKLQVRLLMMDSGILIQHQGKMSNEVAVTGNYFSRYFSREAYDSDLSSSLRRLRAYVNDERKPQRSDQVDLRLYPHFLALNFTAVDEATKDGKILLEFCLPFTDMRVRMLFTRQEHQQAYDVVIDWVERLWKRSRPAGKSDRA